VAKTTNDQVGETEAKAEQAVDAWIGQRLPAVEALRGSVDEIEASGAGWTFAKLTIANAAIREVISSEA
jgi:glutamate dehydrogenase